jgi:WD40-like Beta Propeller Repeat
MDKNLFRIMLLGTVMAMILAGCAEATPTPAPVTVQLATRVAEQPTATIVKQPPAPVVEGRLLFSRFIEASHSFTGSFVSQADGSGESTLPLPGPEGGGRWSWSGKQIAVMTVLTDGRVGTAIIAVDGRVLRVLAIPDPTLNVSCTIWTRDETRLACEAWDDANPSRNGIYTVRASDGKDLQRLTTPPAGMHDLPGDFSPDGKLVFKRHTGDEGPGALMLVAESGGEPRLLYDKQMMEDPGRFSSDGRSVATSTNGRLVVINLDGSVLSEISEKGKYLFGPAWSPDGTRIAFSMSPLGQASADIFTSLPDGSDRQQVTKTPDNEIGLDWGVGSG